MAISMTRNDRRNVETGCAEPVLTAFAEFATWYDYWMRRLDGLMDADWEAGAMRWYPEDDDS